MAWWEWPSSERSRPGPWWFSADALRLSGVLGRKIFSLSGKHFFFLFYFQFSYFSARIHGRTTGPLSLFRFLCGLRSNGRAEIHRRRIRAGQTCMFFFSLPLFLSLFDFFLSTRYSFSFSYLVSVSMSFFPSNFISIFSRVFVFSSLRYLGAVVGCHLSIIPGLPDCTILTAFTKENVVCCFWRSWQVCL